MTEEQIFLAALDLPDAAAREAYLGEVCREDVQLRRKVEALLAAHFKSGEFMDVPAAEQIVVESGASHAVTIDSDVLSATKKPDDEWGSLEFLAPPTRPDALGRIGHYEVLQVLGKGGFGIVFRAFDDVLQRVVAVKVMAPELAATSPARKRFLREARTSAQVRHENVVQVYEVGEQPLPYLVMEFIPGETLQQRLDRVGPLDVLETLRIGRQIAEGLAAAHALDLIHRDIKPGNVLLEAGHHKVKITDFGLARAVDDASMTQSGQIAGTPMYMAPEQALGETLDQRADLFSLGSVLYQMVAGRPPFRANTAIAVLKRVAEDTPRNIREIIPETPQWLCDIIAKLHAKQPAERYQSAREVADVLADCEEQLKANSKLKDYSRIPRGTPTPRSASRRNRLAAAAVVTLLVIALAVTELTRVTHLLRSQQATPAPPQPGVVTLRFDDPTMQFQVDDIGANRTGVSVLQEPLAPGEHWVWFKSGDRQYRTAKFLVTAGERSTLELAVMADGGRATLNGRRLDVTPARQEPPDEPAWAQLFNGQDTKGWIVPAPKAGQGEWRVDRELGQLVGSGPASYLFTERDDFADFHLRAEVSAASGSDSGIFFRCGMTPTGRWFPAGYEANIAHGVEDATGALQTGTLSFTNAVDPRALILVPVSDASVSAETFVTMEVIARGGHMVVKINGKTVAEHTDDKLTYRKGRIALQAYTPQTVVRFKKLEIQELPQTAPPLAIASSEPPAVKLSTWGTFVDPRGECSQMRADHLVSIRVPGTRPYNLLPTPGFNLDAPRLVHEVEEDFLIQATVMPYARPKPNTSSRPGRPVSFRAAGLLVWVNEQTFLRFERASYGEGGNGAPYLNMEWYVAGQPGNTDDTSVPTIPEAPTHLQIERRGQILVLRRSDDGLAWTEAKAVSNMELPQRVSVGLVASNSTNTDFTAVFDNIRLRSQETSPEELGFVKLFNGRNLTGWHTSEVEKWTVAPGGVLVGAARGHLISDRTYQDFHCRIKAKYNFEAIGSIAFRGETDAKGEAIAHGEVGPRNEHELGMKTGSLHLYVKPTSQSLVKWSQELAPADTWFDLDLIVRGKHVVTKVNGTTTADTVLDHLPERGRISLNAYERGTVLEISKIEIKELPPAAPPLAIAPFDAAQAKEHQDAWAKHLGVEPEFTNFIGIKLRLIPPGKNSLGSSGPAESGDAFFVGTTEVTVEQFRRFVDDSQHRTTGETNKLGGMRVQAGKKTERDTNYIWSHPDFAPSEKHPVTLVTWHDAMAFCEWLSRREGGAYRLPTLAEWRWIERAGSASRFAFGDASSTMDAHAWHVGNSEMHTHSVGLKQGNPWGIFDVYGNAWELSYDWERNGKQVDAILAKAGPGAGDRITFAGGGYSASPDDVLGPASGPSDIGYSHLGFRVVLIGDLKASPAAAVE